MIAGPGIGGTGPLIYDIGMPMPALVLVKTKGYRIKKTLYFNIITWKVLCYLAKSITQPI